MRCNRSGKLVLTSRDRKDLWTPTAMSTSGSEDLVTSGAQADSKEHVGSVKDISPDNLCEHLVTPITSNASRVTCVS